MIIKRFKDIEDVCIYYFRKLKSKLLLQTI